MDRNRPLIGICAYEVPAAFAHWRDVTCVMVPSGYTRSVHAAGGAPVVLAPLEGTAELLDVLDGLILSGGSDIGPEHYGQEAHAESTPVWPHRDRAELDLLRAALERDVPVLGICRGMQLLNVVRGGDLHQHLPDVLADAGPHKSAPGTFAQHAVAIEPGSLLSGLVPADARVHSCHHQAPDRLGEGVRVTVRGAGGVAEGIELGGASFAVGVLWHPEEDPGAGACLFRALVDAARDHRVRRVA